MCINIAEMKTINLDTLRVHIFKDLMSLDKEALTEVFAFVTSLKRKTIVENKEKEYEIPDDLLEAIVAEAEKQIERGEVYSTEEVMRIVEQEMGWK